MATQEVSFSAPVDLHEILVAELSEFGFGAFETRGTRIHAFAHVSDPEPKLSLRVQRTLASYGLDDSVATDVHPHRNWNTEWESTIEPVVAGPFLVAPSWADVEPDDLILLRIDPKMSFGTGRHASTRLALRLLARSVRSEDRVLDAGTGTGILAIASIKLGAGLVLGIDTDSTVRENFAENAGRNGVTEHLDFMNGTIEDVRDDGFDIVVANIDRAVLLQSMHHYRNKIHDGGCVILAGLLTTDRSVMCEAARRSKMLVETEVSEGDWWACTLVPDTNKHG